MQTTTDHGTTERALTSLDLYLDHPPGEVVAVDEVTDVAAGMYPVYYAVEDGSVLVSTSVTELVFHLGDLDRDPDHDLPRSMDWMSSPSEDLNPAARLIHAIPNDVTSKFTPDAVVDLVTTLGIISPSNWEFDSSTIDRRVSRLRPFEKVTPRDSSTTFDPDFSLDDPEELIERSVDHLASFVNDVERRFPDHQHVALVGGRDSQLVTLVPKETDNWHVFSAEPNYPLVERFVEENDLDVNRLFRHDNVNRESPAETRKKLVCSDVRNPPRDMRWRVRLAEIAEEFDGDCIFWAGTAADTIYSYYPVGHKQSREEYFDIHYAKLAVKNAITHGTTYNFTGCPLLSPYHSPGIWAELYQRYDPAMMEEGMDLRDEIGRRLHGGPVAWPEDNPSPTQWTYDRGVDPGEIYLEYVRDNLGEDGGRERLVGR